MWSPRTSFPAVVTLAERLAQLGRGAAKRRNVSQGRQTVYSKDHPNRHFIASFKTPSGEHILAHLESHVLTWQQNLYRVLQCARH